MAVSPIISQVQLTPPVAKTSLPVLPTLPVLPNSQTADLKQSAFSDRGHAIFVSQISPAQQSAEFRCARCGKACQPKEHINYVISEPVCSRRLWHLVLHACSTTCKETLIADLDEDNQEMIYSIHCIVDMVTVLKSKLLNTYTAKSASVPPIGSATADGNSLN